MSQEKVKYQAGPDREIRPGCLERYGSPAYEPPDHNDVAALKAISGRSGAELAGMAGVEPRTFRKWLAPPEAKNSARIPYSAWRLLLLELEQIK